MRQIATVGPDSEKDVIPYTFLYLENNHHWSGLYPKESRYEVGN
jgi:hypothetical protein